MGVEDGSFARIATIRSDGVFGAFAASNAIFVARLALAVIVILAVGTLLDAEGAVFGMFAGMARIGSGAVASQFTLRMALLAFFFRNCRISKNPTVPGKFYQRKGGLKKLLLLQFIFFLLSIIPCKIFLLFHMTNTV